MIMSLERSRFVYRCALVVDLLLSAAFAVLSYFASGQQELFFRKMVELCAIAYFIFATTAPCIAIWAAPRKREHGIFAALLYEFNLLTMLPYFLVMVTIAFEATFLIALLAEFEYSPLPAVLAISTVHLVLVIMVLVVDKATDDDKWRSLGQYAALGDDVPVVHHTTDTPNQ
jgi:hypothetical protein